MYYNPMTPVRTPVQGWVEAAKAIRKTNDFRLAGLFVHIEDPLAMDRHDRAVVRHVDAFLRGHGQTPVSTVANTIFPASLDHGDGIEALTERYLPVFNRRMRSGWGRYFHRFVNWPNSKGDVPVNQLAIIIEMLQQARIGTFHTEKYELVVSDPNRDIKKYMGRPCLSLIELKPEKPNRLHMLATYRNHYYIQRTLGNILGLAELQAFIAREAGFEVGTLTLSSTSATLDTVSGAWGKNDVRSLVDACNEMLVKKLAA